MPNPHFDIKITQRSKRQSAVAGAAYQSGDTLFSEYDQKRKSYSEKRGILYTEIMLPENAPPEYADRNTLWNAVEKIENQWNSQLARRFILALPIEVSPEQYPQMIQEYCNEHFVSKGMCCDFAIHDTGTGNPHCHVMLTLRAMDEHGKWLPKSRKVYDLDEHGERIRLPSGNWKSHKENTVDWNEQWHGAIWRQGWQDTQNKFLEAANRPERVDLRSYEKQGIDKVPTVHMGAAVTQMERRGEQTNIGNLNRDIKSANTLMATIRNTISSLRNWIKDLLEARKELLAELEAETAAPTLPVLLMDYVEKRKAERKDWSRYGQQQGTIKDLKTAMSAIAYLKENNILTVEKLEDKVTQISDKATSIRTKMKAKESRMKKISNIKAAIENCQRLKPIHDKYIKINWKIPQKLFAETHQTELTEYNRDFRFLKKQGLDVDSDLTTLQAEYEKLESECSKLKSSLETVQPELKALKDIRYWVSQVMKPSIKDRLAEKKTEMPKECPTEEKTKKQNMEL